MCGVIGVVVDVGVGPAIGVVVDAADVGAVVGVVGVAVVVDDTDGDVVV